MSLRGKKLLILDESVASLCEGFLDLSIHEIFQKIPDGLDVDAIDFTVLTKFDETQKIYGRGIFVGSQADHKTLFESGFVAALHISQLEHEVGQVSFRRLIGENSSLDVEAVMPKGVVDFKNFRFMNHLMMGHYSDIIAREAFLKGHKPLVIRNFFDTLISFLFKFEQEEKVNFPYDIDFGICDDLFVIQLHCSAANLKLSDFSAALGDYKIENPHAGMLKLAVSQSDCLDIYQLKSSQKLVVCAQWLHPLSKKHYTNFYPSLYLHHIDKFSPISHTEVEKGTRPIDVQSEQHDLLSRVIHKLNQIDTQELMVLIGAGDQKAEECHKLKSWLEIDNEIKTVSGETIESENREIVKGRIDVDNSYQVVPGSSLESIERAWRVKREQIIEGLNQKLGTNSIQIADARYEIQDVLKSIFKTSENDVSSFAMELTSHSEDFIAPLSVPKYDFDRKRFEQELVNKDAQIIRMKKLIDRMKMEIQARNTVDILSTHIKRDSSLVSSNELKDPSHHLELKKLKITNERLKTQLTNQSKEKDSMIAALEAKILEMGTNEANVDLDLFSQAENVEGESIDFYKEAIHRAQMALRKFQSDLELARKELKEKESQNDSLLVQLYELKSLQENGGRVGSPTDLEDYTKQLEESKAEVRTLNESLKAQYFELKKLEQKNRFLTAKLDSAQRKVPVVANMSQGKSFSEAQVQRKTKQFEKIVESMKENEQKLQQELISRKEDLRKMKAETITMKNKVADLERKLQKYEKDAA